MEVQGQVPHESWESVRGKREVRLLAPCLGTRDGDGITEEGTLEFDPEG